VFCCSLYKTPLRISTALAIFNNKISAMKSAAILLVILALAACSPSAPDQSAAGANEKIVRQLFDHFNKHDWTAMAELYTDPAEFKDPTFGPGVVTQTHQQTITKYNELQQLFPDIHDDVTEVYPSGDNHVIVEFVSTGTSPDGSAFTLPICTIFTLENGKITQDFTYYDNIENPQAVGDSTTAKM
jgi:ketosteroid isomerase-like protein